MSTASTIKEETRRIVEQLPDDASWEDLIYRISVRQAIEAGLKDADEGRTLPLEEVRRKFGLNLKRHAGAQ
jgi:predicted transcriptional regulator